MSNILKNDLENISELFDLLKFHGMDYLTNLDSRATSSNRIIVKKETEQSKNGVGVKNALDDFLERYNSSLVASSGPRYWGFVTGGSTPASILGDCLASIYDQNTQSTTGNGDNSAVIELETIDMLLDLLDLPKKFLGGFVTGATMSNFTCFAVARQWYGRILEKDFAKEGICEKINILSATAHSSALKSLSMLGIGSKNLLKIKTLGGNREAIDIEDLEKQITELNSAPFILISSAGTVNTVDYDDFCAIEKLKKKYNFWWHIDAAFGAFAACSEKHKHLLKGWEKADSITVDCHKWLNVPYESAVFFIKKEHRGHQVEVFQNSDAPYLGDPMKNFSFLNFLPENSRRLKALAAWFTIKAYGKDGYQAIIENNIELAERLGFWIESSVHFELLAPVRLNTVCFTISKENEKLNVSNFLEKLNQTGMVFMTATKFKGRDGIRAALVNFRTELKDIELVTNLMETVFKELIDDSITSV
jgi:glutamate/tyrosine decarboxylase-like PLP-dependent enzyme